VEKRKHTSEQENTSAKERLTKRKESRPIDQEDKKNKEIFIYRPG